MRFLFLMCFLVLWSTGISTADTLRKDRPTNRNIFIITLDGYRWQELFNGADPALLSDNKYTKDPSVRATLWHPDKRVRRQKLMPFVWTTIAREGQVFGNRELGSHVNTKNFYSLSYPGYNEIFTGTTDPFIWGNKKIKNSNENLLEYLNEFPEYKNKIAAFTSWDVFPYILAKDRSSVFVNSGAGLKQLATAPKMYAALHKMSGKKEHTEQSERNDFLTFSLAKEYIRKHHPKILFLGLGGTDSYGHAKQYDQYLKSAFDADQYIQQLWELVQTEPFYKNNTTIVITTDHGRGNSVSSWYKHGAFVAGSSQTWIMLLGKDIIPMGEQVGKTQLLQTQLAGTIGRLTGVQTFSSNILPPSYFTSTGTK